MTAPARNLDGFVLWVRGRRCLAEPWTLADGRRVYVAGGRAYEIRPDDPFVVEIDAGSEPELAERLSRVRDAKLSLAQEQAARLAYLRSLDEVDPLDWQKARGNFDGERVETTTWHDQVSEDGRSVQRVTQRGHAWRRARANRATWEGLSDERHRAARLIELGFRLITAGIGPKGMPWGERSGAPAGQGLDRERLSDIVSDYWHWAQAASYSGISVAALLSVLLDGESPRAIERQWRRRNGWARSNLHAGLDLYLDQDAIRAAIDRAVEDKRRERPDMAARLDRR